MSREPENSGPELTAREGRKIGSSERLIVHIYGSRDPKFQSSGCARANAAIANGSIANAAIANAAIANGAIANGAIAKESADEMLKEWYLERLEYMTDIQS